MNKTRWMIALGVLVALVVLGSDLVLEKAFSNYRPQGGASVNEAPLTLEPVDMPAAVDSGQEYDRSDLLLSQG
jgi:hypothetical protein